MSLRVLSDFLDLPPKYSNLTWEIRHKLNETTVYINDKLSYITEVGEEGMSLLDIELDNSYYLYWERVDSIAPFFPNYGNTYDEVTSKQLLSNTFSRKYKKSFMGMWLKSLKDLGWHPEELTSSYSIGDDQRLFNKKTLPVYEGLVTDRKLYFPQCYVGLELEFEGVEDTGYRGIFKTVEDHSLKIRGVEFVSIPLPVKYLEIELKRVFNKLSPKISKRCSIHVHMNARDFTYYEFLKFLYLYCLHEKYLYTLTGDRWNNPFCVPCRHNPQAVFSVLSGARILDWWGKYSGINILPLFDDSKKGTIEFRMSEATLDVDRIMTFVNIITGMKKFIKQGHHWKDTPYPIDKEMFQLVSLSQTHNLWS